MSDYGTPSTYEIAGNRYQLHDRIGGGGMGTVYRAYDRLTGQTVALKQVDLSPRTRRPSAGSSNDVRLSLAQEFRTLASLRHPHIVDVLDYGFTTDEGGGRVPYFVMEYLDGARPLNLAAASLSQAQRLELLAQLLEALVYLHRRRILHRDLKPANVLVMDADGEAPYVKVLDFGLSVVMGQAAAGASHAVGTLTYMAPEVLQGGQPSEAADLYAVGVMTVEALAGRYPFPEDDPVELMRHILETAVDVSTLDVAPRFAEVIARLCAKSPAGRYQHAAEVLRLYRELGLNRETGTGSLAVRDSFLQAARFVGRDGEMGQLTTALTQAADGKGSAWLVGGESGVGKSRLLDELRTLALVRDTVVLRGQALSERGQPYAMWREVLRRLCLAAAPTDDEAAILSTAVADLAALLDRTVPPPPEADPATLQEQLLAAVVALVKRAAGAGHPLLFVLEDVHWAGSESMALLRRLGREVAAMPVALIASFRQEEGRDLPRRLADFQPLLLNRLDGDAIADLSESMLGEVGRQQQVVELLERETEGNVFFMVEVVRELAEEAGDLDNIGVMTLPQGVFAGGVERVVRRRLARVPEGHRPLLEAAAVVGRKIDPPLLRAVDPSADVDGWLTACVDAGVLDADDSGTVEGRWRFAHDKLREGLLRDLSPSRRRDLHRTAAEAIEAHVPEPGALATRLAHHWREAADPARELRYVALAGEQAIRSGANPEAVRYFQRGLELLGGMPDFPEKQSYELDFNLALGAAIMARFGYAAPEVAAVYERALDLCRALGSTNRMFQALSNLAGYYMARAEYETARKLGEEMQQVALKTGATTRVLWSHLILGQSLAFMGDYTSAAFHLRQMVDQYDPERRRGSTRFSAIQDFGVSAQAFLGVTVWALGEPDRALALGLESLRTARAINHPFSEAFALHWTGIIHYLRGEYDACLRMAEETLALAGQKNFALFLWLGRVWEGKARVQLGDTSETALDLIRDGMSAYRASGAEFGVPFFLAGLAETLLQAGRIDEAAAALDDAWALMAKTGERWLEPELIRLRGDVAAAQGDATAAEGHYRDGLALASARKGNGFALRSALALARLLADGRPDEARAVLQPIYDAFGEGFDTQDLRAARTVLDALK